MKKKSMYFFSVQLVIFLLMFLFYKEISLVSYANTSFYIGGLITFFGLMAYVISGGFFDLFTESSRKVFTPRHFKKEAATMRLPSEIFSFSYRPIIALGLSSLLCMCLALLVYYS